MKEQPRQVLDVCSKDNIVYLNAKQKSFQSYLFIFELKQESKALAAKLEAEKNALAAQLETGNKEVAERMQKEEEQRKREADEMKVIVFDI